MTETVEQKIQRLDKLKAQKQTLLDRAKAVEKRIARAESTEKTKQRKQESQIKLLLGVAILGAAQRDRNVFSALSKAVEGLSEKDRERITTSDLWISTQKTILQREVPAPTPSTETEIGQLVTRATQLMNKAQ
ncbi:hypothetical protein [Caballeronia sordidicola]|uniref:hypothetical protein n=1 Tax=Caballeronia sordidicola TaxID=196367 RepID=UPI00094D8BA5|nr:hypothetical protein [Caballeronia sordidicola]